jgi:hypothetical protein
MIDASGGNRRLYTVICFELTGLRKFKITGQNVPVPYKNKWTF